MGKEISYSLTRAVEAVTDRLYIQPIVPSMLAIPPIEFVIIGPRQRAFDIGYVAYPVALPAEFEAPA